MSRLLPVAISLAVTGSAWHLYHGVYVSQRGALLQDFMKVERSFKKV